MIRLRVHTKLLESAKQSQNPFSPVLSEQVRRLGTFFKHYSNAVKFSLSSWPQVMRAISLMCFHLFSRCLVLSKKSKLICLRRLLNNTENAHSILKPLCKHRRRMRKIVEAPGRGRRPHPRLKILANTMISDSGEKMLSRKVILTLYN